MLQRIEGLPQGVIGFEAEGEIRSSDYTDVLMPAVQEFWDRGDDVRIVLVFERWEGMSSGAVWKDLKMGVDNLRALEAHRARHRPRLDDHRHVPLRLDDAGRVQALPGRRARPRDRVGGRERRLTEPIRTRP